MGDINQIIEQKRELMQVMADQHGHNFIHPEVVKISQELDLLINQAMKLKS
ncbi:aspartyl-phosphate phosphatase Spo0E family protein [Paenibacillus sinopodophylli]|uniref:aspartyl-phosphate phosphatase Spo0E family protein n=1 Tax=Paenibacillus sinopodophylli TaxID=1837342 RepID=UPI001FE5F255|nr:aspartyl-phosphate phosphatase Spo0E family protein [Paenibacillus sinopodophylli]